MQLFVDAGVRVIELDEGAGRVGEALEDVLLLSGKGKKCTQLAW